MPVRSSVFPLQHGPDDGDFFDAAIRSIRMSTGAHAKIGHEYQLWELEPLLSALRREVSAAKQHGAAAAGEVAHLSFQSYGLYREALTNITGIMTVLGDRLNAVVERDEQKFRERYYRALARVLKMRATVSVDLFQALAAAGSLPMGGREVFLIELNELAKAIEQLKEPDLAKYSENAVSEKLATARHVLEEIVEKAPSLLVLAESAAKKHGARIING